MASGWISSKLPWNLMNPKLASILNPLLAMPQSSAQLIIGFNLVTGANIIPHKLGRQMQGWSLTDLTATITVYRSAPFNSKTLTLTASGPATVNIEVF